MEIREAFIKKKLTKFGHFQTSVSSMSMEYFMDVYVDGLNGHLVISQLSVTSLAVYQSLIVKLGVQDLLSVGSLSSSTKDKLSRSPLDPWSLKL